MNATFIQVHVVIEVADTFVMVDCIRKMTTRKLCAYDKSRVFKHFDLFSSTELTEMLPGILNQLGSEGLNSLRKLASTVTSGESLNPLFMAKTFLLEIRMWG